jgi:hypothetical protein
MDQQEEPLLPVSREPLLRPLERLLDADGDGDVMDDVAKIGGGLLGRLFGGRR